MALPFVHHYCRCDAKDDDPDQAATVDIGEHLMGSKASSALHPLSRLYFCEDCHDIKCSACVQDEIISYYCPNCLFEVPTASVKSEKNRCARNCFACPCCFSTLAVVASKEPTASQINIGPYFLACNVCRWTSRDIDMTFEKPTSLALQLQKQEDEQADVQEFDHLKEHFEKQLRIGATLPSSFLSFSSSGAFSKMGGHLFDPIPATSTSTSLAATHLDDMGEYTSLGNPMDAAQEEHDVVAALTDLRDTSGMATLAQRFTQVHDQPYHLQRIQPQRIHLAIKRAKRCRTCRHILVKPEQKAQATRFKIKLVAMNYIPTISIAAIAPPAPTTASIAALVAPEPKITLAIGKTTQFVLKFVNPLYEEMSISLATPRLDADDTDNVKDGTPIAATTTCGRVTILAPHFSVSAYNETIEYDDDMYPVHQGATRKTTSKAVNGVHERRNNYTSVLIEVLPEKTGEFKFPLFVTCHYKSDEDRMDVSSGDIEEEFMEVDSMDGSRKGNSSIRMDDDRTRHYSFWTVIGLGDVAEI